MRIVRSAQPQTHPLKTVVSLFAVHLVVADDFYLLQH
jgi:hypothetical protein